MSRKFLVPKIALSSIWRNRKMYIPYLITTILSVAVFFTFSSVTHSKIVETVPHAAYFAMIMAIGEVLIAIILFPFLSQTNNYLIRCREREFGLYQVLGLEKKHISLMILIESLILYTVSFFAGVGVACLLGNLIFALMAKLGHLGNGITFAFEINSFHITAVMFAVIFIWNCIMNMIRIGRIEPTELMKEGKKGEKNVRFLPAKAFIGIVLIVGTYFWCINMKLDEMIFFEIFGTVFVLIIGTYLFFTSGTVFILNRMKKNKNYYYKKDHFITVSGMLYRMKTNAMSLSNITLFGMLIMMTLICTITLVMGQEEAGRFSYAYDMTYTFTGDAAANKSGVESLESLEKKSGVTGKDRIMYTYGSVDEKRSGNVFAKSGDADGNGNGCTVRLITQDVYNDLVDEQLNKAKDAGSAENASNVAKKDRIESKPVDDNGLGIGTEKLSLEKDEIAVYATDEDFEGSSLSFEGKELKVVRILEDLPLARHNKARIGTSFYYFVVSDEDMIRKITDDNIYTSYSMNFADSDKDIRAKFANEAFTVSQSLPNYFRLDSYDIENADNVAMNGGLLFIGIFFSIIFAACLVMIMYYRQLSEGLEDREKFDILRKVGFDSRDAKKTIKDQMKIVFVMPAAMAVFHVLGCLNLPRTLFYTLNFYNVSYIIKASCIVIVIYIAFYFLCYQLTEKEYYNIVMSK